MRCGHFFPGRDERSAQTATTLATSLAIAPATAQTAPTWTTSTANGGFRHSAAVSPVLVSPLKSCEPPGAVAETVGFHADAVKQRQVQVAQGGASRVADVSTTLQAPASY
jgi:hypothetical protein